MIIVWTRREQLKAWLLLFMLGFPLLRPLGRIILNFHSSVKYRLWEMEIKKVGKVERRASCVVTRV